MPKVVERGGAPEQQVILERQFPPVIELPKEHILKHSGPDAVEKAGQARELEERTSGEKGYDPKHSEMIRRIIAGSDLDEVSKKAAYWILTNGSRDEIMRAVHDLRAHNHEAKKLGENEQDGRRLSKQMGDRFIGYVSKGIEAANAKPGSIGTSLASVDDALVAVGRRNLESGDVPVNDDNLGMAKFQALMDDGLTGFLNGVITDSVREKMSGGALALAAIAGATILSDYLDRERKKKKKGDAVAAAEREAERRIIQGGVSPEQVNRVVSVESLVEQYGLDEHEALQLVQGVQNSPEFQNMVADVKLGGAGHVVLSNALKYALIKKADKFGLLLGKVNDAGLQLTDLDQDDQMAA